EQARRLGNPKSSRAVGQANGDNKILIVVPCHRVIGKNGKMTGFSSEGGIKIKEYLLELEKNNK
ncbi:MAG: methylated-DNA--[protein]-cysteine S-methyltransferase, partial [Fusobacterium sp.]